MWYFFIAIIVIAVDQLTKWMVIENFQLYEVREIIPGFFNLVYVENRGAAFSFLADVDSPWRHYFFVGVSVAAVIGLTCYFFLSRMEMGGKRAAVALGLIAGGAVGNLIDRIRLGAVTDFLDCYYGAWHWPAFNVADSAICIGAFLLVLFAVFSSRKNNYKRIEL